ncbi:hypothetical protein PC120_g6907 [Phytophthora cactorum]|nr:hypothetical protein PC120_g6907 [Phytophthora cactorum]
MPLQQCMPPSPARKGLLRQIIKPEFDQVSDRSTAEWKINDLKTLGVIVIEIGDGAHCLVLKITVFVVLADIRDVNQNECCQFVAASVNLPSELVDLPVNCVVDSQSSPEDGEEAICPESDEFEAGQKPTVTSLKVIE